MDLKNYDKRMFELSVASCAAANCSGPNINLDAYCAISQSLKNKAWNVEDWEIVWGPGVSVKQSDFANQPQVYPSDLMFVARNSSSYFVSVAATNYLSVFDIEEDFRVQRLVPWPYALEKPTTSPQARQVPKISRGFHESLKILQTMKPGRGLPGEGLTLCEFFRDEVAKEIANIDIITGGHSQGGATAPLVALWLLDTQPTWDPTPKATFSCYRSAGPTPGNDDFAAYYDSSLPATVSLVNPLDFVPKMFVEKELIKVPRIYEPQIGPSSEIRQLIGSMVVLAARGRYTQIAGGRDQLVEMTDARVNQNISGATECERFTKQMGYQHAQAYFDLLGISADISVDQFAGLCA